MISQRIARRFASRLVQCRTRVVGTKRCIISTTKSHISSSSKTSKYSSQLSMIEEKYSCIRSLSQMPNFDHQVMDFFEEPISFLAKESVKGDSPTDSILVFDTHLIQMLSKGQASNDGGDEFGLRTKAAHSSAITWADLIRHLSFWCANDRDGNMICNAPMMAVAAFAPLLIEGGKAYIMNLDENYVKAKPSFQSMIQAAIDCRDDDRLSQRESYHLWALAYLFENEHAKALAVLSQLLEMAPGDALALSLAFDLVDVLGDKDAAFHIATGVGSYWNERGRRSPTGQTTIQGHSIGSSLIAKGLAIGGRLREAEQIADKALSRDSQGSSGLAAASLAHIYNSEGRASEGASTFTGDGIEFYNACGYLFFDSKMGGLGAKFICDRDGASSDRVAIRLYDEHFQRVLEYSGYDGAQNVPVIRRIPMTKKEMFVDTASGAASSFLGSIFGAKGNDSSDTEGEKIEKDEIIENSEKRTLEDVLTWLPPTLTLLSDATFLLFRLTISGAVESSDNRWKSLANSWRVAISIDSTYSSDFEGRLCLTHSPLGRIAISLVNPNLLHEEPLKESHRISDKIETATQKLGKIMRICAENEEPIGTSDTTKSTWIEIVSLLSEAKLGWTKERNDTNNFVLPSKQLLDDYKGFDLNIGNFIDDAICFAAIQSDDYNSLCTARYVCSSSVMLQTNSPSNWYRYGTILEKMGDEDNANDAFHASVSLGSGEGGRVGAQ